MQAKSNTPNLSVISTTPWQLLKTDKLSCEEAITKLVNPDGTVNRNLLDAEVYDLFFRQARNQIELPNFIPLLFWRKRFFIGAPEAISDLDIKRIGNLIDMTVNTKTQSRGDRWYKRRETKEEAKCQEYIS